ncbi:MAG: hypothetical protein IJT91_01365 [Clostridia bacterium]|nr:hypothetical protein [Clostridia bacterium]
MKKIILIALCLLALAYFCGCTANQQNEAETTGAASDMTVDFINDVNGADVWILPQTEANLRTTLWGTATAADVGKGESRAVPLCEPGDEGLYIFRMTDNDGYYYSANGITLRDGWTVKITGEVPYKVTLEVTDENGVSKGTCEVFSAKL